MRSAHVVSHARVINRSFDSFPVAPLTALFLLYILCHFLYYYHNLLLLCPSPRRAMAKPKNDAGRRRSLSDPLAAALLPPPNESPVQREMRLKAETEAKKVSEGIDEMIRQERSERKKSKAEINVLLLGQSESGKSTTLKREHCCFASWFSFSWYCFADVILFFHCKENSGGGQPSQGHSKCQLPK